MIPRNPYENMPSTAQESCDLGDCVEPWADTVDARNGLRPLRLCERHHDEWLKAEAELDAEIEEMAGRHEAPLPLAPLFALARAIDGRRRNGRKAG